MNKVAEFGRAIVAGYFRDMALAKRGTGELREPLSQKEYAKRKKRNKMAKASRRGNR